MRIRGTIRLQALHLLIIRDECSADTEVLETLWVPSLQIKQGETNIQ